MRVTGLFISTLLGCAALAGQLSREEVIAYLTRMRAVERGMMNVSPAEGEHLAGLVSKLNARQVLEIGTSNGYSGIWLALGLRETGGRLITLEVDRGRHNLALQNFQATGLAPIIDARLTDALREIPKLEGPFDLIFIDAWKPDYIRYLRMTLPKLRKGGAIVAHNVDSHAGEMADYLEEVRKNPALKTEFVRLTSAGMSVTYKQ